MIDYPTEQSALFVCQHYAIMYIMTDGFKCSLASVEFLCLILLQIVLSF